MPTEDKQASVSPEKHQNCSPSNNNDNLEALLAKNPFVFLGVQPIPFFSNFDYSTGTLKVPSVTTISQSVKA